MTSSNSSGASGTSFGWPLGGATTAPLSALKLNHRSPIWSDCAPKCSTKLRLGARSSRESRQVGDTAGSGSTYLHAVHIGAQFLLD